jgi:SAM-dependent methyltransferase
MVPDVPAMNGAGTPGWLLKMLGLGQVAEGAAAEVTGTRYLMNGGILRAEQLLSGGQEQTAETFGFKWSLRDTFESEVSRARMRDWLIERYGDVERAPWWSDYGDNPVVLDAGCGAGLSALELFGEKLADVRYLGVDVSEAVDVAAERFAERGLRAGFLQADLLRLPVPERSVHVIFSEGVLHHTDSTRAALGAVARLLAPGGRLLFYVYRRKGPVREFTDDYVRGRLREMAPEDAWRAVEPITQLGRMLGELELEVVVPEDVELLGIPAGPIDVQRLFYWHVLKAYHHPDLTLEELNHINYDWYAPRNAHRQSPEEVRAWCGELGLEVEREDVQEAGITIVCRRT